MEGGLPSGQTDPIDPPLPFPQALQDGLPGKIVISLGPADQFVVMAEGAAEITGGEEEDRDDFPEPIGKRSLKEPLDWIVHDNQQLSAISRQLLTCGGDS
jgi:hypothetical protein